VSQDVISRRWYDEAVQFAVAWLRLLALERALEHRHRPEFGAGIQPLSGSRLHHPFDVGELGVK
jgi:hypothetical protein